MALYLLASSGCGIPGNAFDMVISNTFYYKLLIGIIMFLFFTPVSLFAQEIEKKGHFAIGAEGGVQITNIKGFSGYSATSKVGYSAGVFGDYYLNNDFKIRLGAYFDNRKFELERYQPGLANEIGDSVYITYRSWYLYQVDYGLNYLTIPIGIIYSKGNEKFKLMIQLNFYYSIFLNGTMKGSDNYYIDPNDAEYFIDVGYYEDRNFQAGANITDYSGSTNAASFDQDRIQYLFNTFDFGTNFLIGGVYNVTQKIGISASIGFTLSFGDLFQESDIDTKWTQATKFNLGFVYLLEKKNKKFGQK